MSTADPITLVHNVAQEAAFSAAGPSGASSFGFNAFSVTNTHTVTGILRDIVPAGGEGLYASQAANFGVPQEEIWLWLMWASCSATDGGDFDQAALAVRGGTNQDDDDLTNLYFWNEALFAAVAGNSMARSTSGVPMLQPMPLLLLPPAEIILATEADNGGTTAITVNGVIYTGPRFTMPPGL